MIVRFRLIIALFLLLALPASWVAAQETAAAPVAQIVTQGAPRVEDGQVELDFSVSDQSGLAPAELTASSIKLSEPADNLTLTSRDDRALTLAVIVNLSNGSDVDLIQNTLRAYFNDYYQAGDNVTFYVLGPEANQAQVAVAADQAAALELVDSLKRSPNVYSITPTLRAALAMLQAADEETARQVLYVGSFLNDPQETNASSIFAGQQIPFNVVLVHRYRPQAVAEHRTLATFGGGLFANNENGSGVGLDGIPTAINSLKVMFDALANSRRVYTLRYQSGSQNLDPERTVTLTVTLPDSTQASEPFQYAPVFAPPQVEIISAAPDLIRMPTYSGNRIVFDMTERFVTVSITFPDGVRRGIKSLELQATDANGRSRPPRVINAPAPDGSGNYSIPWTFDDYTTPETVNQINLTVTAEDQLGMSSSASQTARLTVAALPPAPIPTVTVAPTAEASSDGSMLGGGSVADNLLFSVLAAFVLALIVVVVFLLMMLARANRQRSHYARMAQLAAQQPVAPMPVAAPVAATPAAPAPEPEPPEETTLLGRLVTVNGLEVTEIPITAEEFTIGRDPSCNYVINQPFISPRHCTIMLRKKTFFIRDLGGKNGTFVNGERLPKNRDIPVPLGSEVNLTMNISMELWDAKTVVKLHDRKTSYTHHSSVATKTAQASDELELRSVFGIKFAGEDEGKVGDDYSPI
ncbi:MAG: FHA domain-containing protein [Anaerolineae bacterium]|nr:FHA domain-containing protein [Anaerolineae bacterium]